MMKRVNVYLDDDLWLAFRMKCLERRISASKALGDLMKQFLAQARSRSTTRHRGTRGSSR